MTGTCGSTFGGRWVEAPRQPERTNAFRSELGRRLRPPPRPGRRRPGSAPRIELSPDVSATACNASLSGRCCDDSLNPRALDRPVWRQTGPNSGWLSFRLSGKDGDVHLPGRPRSRCVSVADLHVKNAFPPIDQALRKRDDDRAAGDHNAEAWRQLVCTRTSVIAREY